MSRKTTNLSSEMSASRTNDLEPKLYIKIVGLIKEQSFHIAKSIIEGLKQKFPREFVDPEILALLEFDWHAFLDNQKKEMRGEMWQFSSGVMCFVDGQFIGDNDALVTWAKDQWAFTCDQPEASVCLRSDESFALSHAKRGTLGMANKGPHSNGSQFYITLQQTRWMDLTYVAFGQVVEGVDVLRRIEEAPTTNQRPKKECTVANCGVFKL